MKRKRRRLVKKQGVWVFRGDQPLTVAMVEKTARKIRKERSRFVTGKVS